MTKIQKNRIKQGLFEKMLDGISGTFFEMRIHYSTLFGSGCYKDDIVYIEKKDLVDLVKECASLKGPDNNCCIDVAKGFIGSIARQRGFELVKYNLILESPIPEELSEIAADLADQRFIESEDINDIRSEIEDVKEDEYTFDVTINVENFFKNDLNTERVHLTQDEARGLLMECCAKKSLFDGLCDKPLSEDSLFEIIKKLDYTEKIKKKIHVFGYSEELSNFLIEWRKIRRRLFKMNFSEKDYDDFKYEIRVNHTLDNYTKIEEEEMKNLAIKAMQEISGMTVWIELGFDIEDTLHKQFDTNMLKFLDADFIRRLVRGALRDDYYDFGPDYLRCNDWLDEMAHNYAVKTIKEQIMQVSQTPQELYELKEEIDNVDVTDSRAVMEIQNQINEIAAGTYCFSVNFEQYDIPDYLLGDEDYIDLTADEAKGLLMYDCDKKELFEEMGIKPLDVEKLKCREFDIDGLFDTHLECYHSCEELSDCIEYWRKRIEYIYENGVDEYSISVTD